jgi:hypothetical protein
MALTTAAVVGAVGAVGGAAMSSHAAKKARHAQTKAAQESIDFQRESRDLALAYQRPQREAGYAATAALMDLVGLDRSARPGSAIDMAQGEDGSWSMPSGIGGSAGLLGAALSRKMPSSGSAGPEAGGPDVPDLSSYAHYDFKADPGYQFRLDEGNRALNNSLVARSGALSGAALKASLRYNQNYASNEYQNVYNRIAQIAGFGSATAQGAQTIVNTGANVGNTLVNAGEARASSYVAQGNAWSNAFNQVGQLAGYGWRGPMSATEAVNYTPNPNVGYA